MLVPLWVVVAMVICFLIFRAANAAKGAKGEEEAWLSLAAMFFLGNVLFAWLFACSVFGWF